MKTIRVVAAVIVREKNNQKQIFATQRGYGELKGGWEFPGGKIEEGERTPLAYIVVETAELPSSAQEMIQEKKDRDFQMTYQKGDTVYLIRGYGKKMSGGYSIQVAELSVSSTAVFFKTRLIGPEKENQSGAPSYPYIAVKTEYREEPVIFE